MKATTLIFFSVLIFIGLISCNDSVNFDDLREIGNTIHPKTGPESINFATPVDGQKSKYVRYVAECGQLAPVSFTGDTLELVISGSGSQWQLTESYTSGSPLFDSGRNRFTQSYELQDGYALIQERSASQLFWFYGNDTLFFNSPQIISLHQEDCRLAIAPEEIFIGDEMGQFDEFRVGQIAIRDKKAVSCIPIWVSIEAYLIYDSQNLALSHTIRGDQIDGWLQIE